MTRSSEPNKQTRLSYYGEKLSKSFPVYKLLSSILCLLPLVAPAQKTYTNPVLFSDYSDPDILRVGQDFYLVASTFTFSPGLPILHSRDLVHWELLTHALPRLDLGPLYDMQGGSRYGRGVWAPALREHNGTFYLYFPTPDEGIFVTTARSMAGPWSPVTTVLAGPGLEDPCPFWDDDGQAYLVHSKTGAGPLILHRMSADGKTLLDAGRIIVKDPVHLHTLEGPKLYKRNGWYYIFAPFGGVSTGAQAVLRSRSIDGPYESRVVLQQGDTAINGPHQGGWVDAPDGRAWFLHFQSRGAHGRIDHLEPMRWLPDDWPVMGDLALAAQPPTTQPGTDYLVGQPVPSGPAPVALPARAVSATHIQTSDEFSAGTLNQMWEWNHNPDNTRWSLSERPGFLRLHPTEAASLLAARNTLTEQPQDESFQFTARVDLSHLTPGDHAGISMFDKNLNSLAVVQTGKERRLVLTLSGAENPGPVLSESILDLRVTMHVDSTQYSYSLDRGKTFLPLGPPVNAIFSWWKGARPALFSFNPAQSPGYLDIDWVHYQSLP